MAIAAFFALAHLTEPASIRRDGFARAPFVVGRGGGPKEDRRRSR